MDHIICTLLGYVCCILIIIAKLYIYLVNNVKWILSYKFYNITFEACDKINSCIEYYVSFKHV